MGEGEWGGVGQERAYLKLLVQSAKHFIFL